MDTDPCPRCGEVDWVRVGTRQDRRCRPCALRRGRERYARASVEQRRAWAWKQRAKRYGLTVEELTRMWEGCGGRCWICNVEMQAYQREKEGPTRTVMVIDHCHQTGQVRGLICHRCNTALGAFDDDPARVKRALDYLQALWPVRE